MSQPENHCDGCSKENCDHCDQKSFLAAPHSKSNIKHVIGIMSGKGGVGKSSTAASLAVLLKRKGYKVGILDADITGPSIPKMFGTKEKVVGNDEGIFPILSKSGIKIMSINLLLADEEAPVIWRGPVIGGTVKQFWTDVMWGELDYLLIDMPPGTGDVPLTIFQSIPVENVIIVTSPQSLVSMIVKKAYHMADKMNIPVLGFVENMSYVACPDCGKKIFVFGESNLEKTASELNTKVLAQMPLDPTMALLCDGGHIEELSTDFLDNAVEEIEKA